MNSDQLTYDKFLNFFVIKIDKLNIHEPVMPPNHAKIAPIL